MVTPFFTILDRTKTKGAGIAQWYSDWPTGWTTEVRFSAGAENFFRHRVQTGSKAHADSCPMDTGGSFLGVKLPERETDHSP
jgi:hypothetical protein